MNYKINIILGCTYIIHTPILNLFVYYFFSPYFVFLKFLALANLHCKSYRLKNILFIHTYIFPLSFFPHHTFLLTYSLKSHLYFFYNNKLFILLIFLVYKHSNFSLIYSFFLLFRFGSLLIRILFILLLLLYFKTYTYIYLNTYILETLYVRYSNILFIHNYINICNYSQCLILRPFFPKDFFGRS